MVNESCCGGHQGGKTLFQLANALSAAVARGKKKSISQRERERERELMYIPARCVFHTNKRISVTARWSLAAKKRKITREGKKLSSVSTSFISFVFRRALFFYSQQFLFLCVSLSQSAKNPPFHSACIYLCTLRISFGNNYNISLLCFSLSQWSRVMT